MARKFYTEENEAIPAIAFEISQPVGFVEITDATKLKELFKKKYNERTKDGQNYYNEFRTNLYLKIINLEITNQQAFEVETHLKNLADNLNTGNWLTAQYTNTNLPLSGIYDEAMKNDIQLDIDNYIGENY